MSELGKSLLLQAYVRAECDGSGACRKITPESKSVWLLPERRRQSYDCIGPSQAPTRTAIPPSTSAPCLGWAHPPHDCARNRLAPAVPRRPRQAVPSARVLGTRPSGRSELGRAPPHASVRPCSLHAAKWAIRIGTSTACFRPPVSSARDQAGDPTWDEHHRKLPSVHVFSTRPSGRSHLGRAPHASVRRRLPWLTSTRCPRRCTLRGTDRRDRRPLRSTFESRRRRGWGEPSPDADVAGVSPVSAQMWPG